MRYCCFIFTLLILFIGCAPSEPVDIPDPDLAAAVRRALNILPEEPIIQKKLDELESLSVEYGDIENLTGIEK